MRRLRHFKGYSANQEEEEEEELKIKIKISGENIYDFFEAGTQRSAMTSKKEELHLQLVLRSYNEFRYYKKNIKFCLKVTF